MIRFPFMDMQQLNLDWLMSKVRSILAFLPQNGAVGQILRRTASGAEWSNENVGAVDSVNGQTGDVVLDAADVGALPDTYTAPVTSVNTQTGDVVLDAAAVGAVPAPYTPPWYYGTCSTAAATVQKEVSIPEITILSAGVTIRVKFEERNTATNPTLKLNNFAALPLYQYGTTAIGGTDATTGWYAGSVVQFVYDGTGWIRDQAYNTNTTYTTTNVYCATAAATAAKTATGTYFAMQGGQSFIFEITFRYTNTKAAALTLNVNNTGAKPLYIDGVPSSASNYTIKAGKYFCAYYDVEDAYFLYNPTGLYGPRYMGDIVGRLTGNVVGTASGNVPNSVVQSVQINANTPLTLTFSQPARCMLVIASANAGTRGIYVINCNAAGTVAYSAALSATDLTIGTGTGSMTLTLPNLGDICVLTFKGTVTIS